ncbi:Chromosome transmission fidelity protein 18, partial [Coemansia nantahalensis]
RRRRQRGEHGPLLRPIICICNNVYAPVLRPLRQIAQWYHVGAPTPARLAQRLEEVCGLEGVAADRWGLLDLAKQHEGDVRSCLNALQMVSQRAPRVGPEQLKSSAVGMKDVQRSLFAVWTMVFSSPNASSLGKRHSVGAAARKPSLEREYAELVVQSVRSSGERERLMQGCVENYLRMEFRDLTHTRVANLCTDWFGFYDTVDAATRRTPATADTLAAYMDYALLAVHRTCSTQIGLSRGDFEYPHSEFEAFQGRQAAASILQALLAGATCLRTRWSFTAASAAEGLADYLLHILSPQLVTANKHLLKGAERDRMVRLVKVMDAWQLALVQNRDADGQFVYRLEPPVDRLYGFNGRRPPRAIMPMRYPVRQLVSQELERARLARLAARSGDSRDSAPDASPDAKDQAKRDYLRQLFCRSARRHDCRRLRR